MKAAIATVVPMNAEEEMSEEPPRKRRGVGQRRTHRRDKSKRQREEEKMRVPSLCHDTDLNRYTGCKMGTFDHNRRLQCMRQCTRLSAVHLDTP
eukprot:1033329-Amphidinium_carterae.2